MTRQEEVGKRLRWLRRIKSALDDRDIRKTQLAALVDVESESYGRYETGERKLPDDKAVILAEFFGVTPGYIKFGEPSVEQPIAKGLPVNDVLVEAGRLVQAAKLAAEGQPRPKRRRGQR